MRIALAYVTVTGGRSTDIYAARFAASYFGCPPDDEHDTFILCNGGEPAKTTRIILQGLPNLTWYPRSNSGWDIGGYIEIARERCSSYDLILCLGESVFMHRRGWLKRIADNWETFGPGMYGFLSSNVIRPHLGTTAFATSPELLLKYPYLVENGNQRYEFEHGRNSFWQYVEKRGLPVALITWDASWTPRHWREPDNILWRGDQSNCLFWCNHVERFQRAPREVRNAWARQIDAPFR